MDNENKVSASCVMLAVNLMTPVSLLSVFDSDDLKDTGLVYDHHITLLYARDKKLDKMDVLGAIPMSFTDVLEKKKDPEEFAYPVMSLFELGSFENDSGYIVLKLKKESAWFESLSNINSTLMNRYDIKSDFPNYTPHVSLAELEPGMTEKYLENETLKLILGHSVIHFEDIIISYDYEGKDGYDVHDLTHFHSVDRFFRIREAKKDDKDLH